MHTVNSLVLILALRMDCSAKGPLPCAWQGHQAQLQTIVPLLGGWAASLETHLFLDLIYSVQIVTATDSLLLRGFSPHLFLKALVPPQGFPAQGFILDPPTLPNNLLLPGSYSDFVWASPGLSSSTTDPLPTEGRLVNSCIQARRKCQFDPICSAAYHHLNSCTSSVSTPSPAQELLVPEECREAAQHLRNSSLMSCTCHRRMKNQVACLDIYWTIHLARSLGEAPIIEWTKEGGSCGLLFNPAEYRPDG